MKPLAMLRSSTTSYYHADGLGTITSLSHATNALAQTYGYDSFGQMIACIPSAVITSPFATVKRGFDRIVLSASTSASKLGL